MHSLEINNLFSALDKTPRCGRLLRATFATKATEQGPAKPSFVCPADRNLGDPAVQVGPDAIPCGGAGVREDAPGNSVHCVSNGAVLGPGSGCGSVPGALYLVPVLCALYYLLALPLTSSFHVKGARDSAIGECPWRPAEWTSSQVVLYERLLR